MSRRVVVGIAILALWAVGLALLARREFFRPDAERMALAGLRVAPGASYYAVERGGRAVGWASSTVDTTAGEIVIEDRLVSEPTADARTDVRASVSLSRAMQPRRFLLRVQSAALPIVVTGLTRGDSALELRVSADGAAAEPQIVPTRGRVYPATAVPLLVALGEQRRVGGRLAVTLFDPTAMSTRDAVLRVTAESLFTVSDSARFDDAAGRWVSAHRDTVRAWLVRAEGDSTASLAGWVDAQGRMVEATYPGGYVLRRTSFEEATENWRRGLVARAPAAAAAAAPPAAVPAPPAGLRPTR